MHARTHMQNEGPGLQHMALKTDDIITTVRCGQRASHSAVSMGCSAVGCAVVGAALRGAQCHVVHSTAALRGGCCRRVGAACQQHRHLCCLPWREAVAWPAPAHALHVPCTCPAHAPAHALHMPCARSEMRARSLNGGFDFMPRPSDKYYRDLPAKVRACGHGGSPSAWHGVYCAWGV